uniref:PTPc_motif domain-containing protein n=1 Tax=Macrostomum lignano TaxID=282301 RepID=A0A1I8JQD0_9PLAT
MSPTQPQPPRCRRPASAVSITTLSVQPQEFAAYAKKLLADAPASVISTSGMDTELLQYMEWEDHAVPNLDNLASFSAGCTARQRNGGGGRIRVGRTGTFIALDLLARRLQDCQERQEVSVYETVLQLRALSGGHGADQELLYSKKSRLSTIKLFNYCYSIMSTTMNSRTVVDKTTESYYISYRRNLLAVGVMWAIFVVCLAIINVVVVAQPQWIGDTSSSPGVGFFGLIRYCQLYQTGTNLVCDGRLDDFSTILNDAFRAATVMSGLAALLALTTIVLMILFFFVRTPEWGVSDLRHCAGCY